MMESGMVSSLQVLGGIHLHVVDRRSSPSLKRHTHDGYSTLKASGHGPQSFVQRWLPSPPPPLSLPSQSPILPVRSHMIHFQWTHLGLRA